MSFLSGLFGQNGMNFQAQSGNPISPLAGGAPDAIAQSQGAIGQQQQLATALQQAGGIQNQQNVYSQLGNIANGQGPNPARAQLSQATGQNVANQASLMAGQRGASQNAGLIARQAGQQGAATQQQAAGQAATLQAQQSLGALGQQAGIAGQQVGNQLTAQGALTGAAQGQAGQLIGANVAQNTASIQNAQQQNASNAAIAGVNAQGQQQLLGNVVGGIGALGDLLAEGGIVGNYDNGGDIPDFEAGNSFTPTPTIQTPAAPSKSGGGKSSGGGGAGLLALMAPGGTVQQYGGNGGIPNFFGSSPKSTDQSSFASSLAGGGAKAYQTGQAGVQIGQGIANGLNDLFGSSATSSGSAVGYGVSTTASNPEADIGDYSALAGGGKVKALLSPGEKYLPPNEVKKVAKGEKPAINAGEIIKGGKAKVPGDSLKNDTVKKTLTEDGIVIPRSITQGKNPGPAAAKFVEALLKKHGKSVKKVVA